MNLLIVDDEAKIRNGLRKHLEQMPLRFDVVETAENACTALEIVRRIRPEIILVDIRMPGMDGLEFLEIVSEDMPGFKAIVISGYDDFAYAQKAIRCGVNEYVLKPIDLPKFDAMISRIYDEVLEEQGRQNRADFAIDTLERNREHLIDKLFTRFVNGEAEYEEIESVSSLMGAALPSPSRLLVFRAADDLADGNTSTPNLSSDAVRNILKGLSAERCLNSLIFCDDRKNVVMLSQPDAGDDYADFCRAVQDKVGSSLGHVVQWDVSELTDTAAQLSDAYQKAIRRFSGDNAYSETVLRAKHFIEQNYYRYDLSLKATADELNVNPSHLSRQMRLQLGMGFVDYLTCYRMEKARFLLRSLGKGVKIYEIATKVGYSSQHYFTRVFTNYFGMSPLKHKALQLDEDVTTVPESHDGETGGK